MSDTADDRKFPVPTHLRDYFAGLSLEEARSRADKTRDFELKALFGEGRSSIRREEIVAAYAYQLADAMLAEREKGSQP